MTHVELSAMGLVHTVKRREDVKRGWRAPSSLYWLTRLHAGEMAKRNLWLELPVLMHTAQSSGYLLSKLNSQISKLTTLPNRSQITIYL